MHGPVALGRDQLRAIRGALKLLEQHEGAEAVRTVQNRLQRLGGDLPSLAVIGETGRGKSTLVNALLGGPLSPVGSERTTGIHLEFRPADGATESGEALILLSDGSRLEVACGELASWVTVDRLRSRDLVTPVAAAVEASSPHLPGTILLDTPGVGGLDVAHSRLTLAAAEYASAILFVIDAGQPMTAPEYELLSRASEHVDVVLFALAKTDKHPVGWREVLEEDRELLRRHVPRLAEAPILPVAATLALEALTAADDDRDALLAGSGVPGLVEQLQDILGDIQRLRANNALRTVRTALERVSQRLSLELAVSRDEPDVEDVVAAEREQLQLLAQREERWGLELDRDLGHLRSSVVESIQDGCQRLTARYGTEISRARRAATDEAARTLTDQLTSDLASIAEAAGRMLLEGLARVLEQALVASDAAAVVEDVLRATPQGLPAPADAPTRDGLRLEPQSAMPMMWIVHGIGNPVLLPVAGFMFAAQRRQAARSRLQAWARDEIASSQRRAINAVDGLLRDVRPELVLAIRRDLRTRITECKRIVTAAEQAAIRTREERLRRVALLEGHLEAATAQLRELDATTERVPGNLPATPGI